jgi:hypothetical protein
MGDRVINLYAPVRGGVSDYVDVCLEHDSEHEKLSLEKKTALHTPLSDQCLLHYSGYGYANRGTPLWLLNKVKTDRPHIKTLGIFFHELYAFGPPSGSAFWLSPVQRHIVRRLAEISDFWVTNREGSAQWLRQFASNKPHAVLPVFSNVGEMPAYIPERAPKIVVFGGAGLRTSTYRAAGEALFSWAREQELELHDIGPPVDDPVLSASLQGAGVVQHGRLEPEEVSKQLSNALFGILAYPVDYVAKSGVFAAYCAHGMCPVLISKRHEPVDGLVTGNHYLAGLPVGAIQHSIVQNIGSASWDWYQPHRAMAHLATLKRLLREVGPIMPKLSLEPISNDNDHINRPNLF